MVMREISDFCSVLENLSQRLNGFASIASIYLLSPGGCVQNCTCEINGDRCVNLENKFKTICYHMTFRRNCVCAGEGVALMRSDHE